MSSGPLIYTFFLLQRWCAHRHSLEEFGFAAVVELSCWPIDITTIFFSAYFLATLFFTVVVFSSTWSIFIHVLRRCGDDVVIVGWCDSGGPHLSSSFFATVWCLSENLLLGGVDYYWELGDWERDYWGKRIIIGHL